LKKALFLVGDGDTGKSQLKSLVERILGRGNFIGIDLKEIESRFGTGAVYGTRLAGSSDMSFLSVDVLKTFKKMTGGDSLYAEFKGQQAFEFTYNGLLWFCMNRLPKFGGDDGKWVYDRIMVVKCQNVIPKDEQDKQLLDKMYAERDGIVYKAVKALQTVIANGYRFSEPKSVTDARVQYQMENNTVISFFEDCMCEREGGKITDACTTGKIYKIYKAWCQDNNNGFAKTYKEFRTKLAEHLGAAFEDMIVKRNSGTFYKAYTLTAECKKEYSGVYGYDETEFLN
jgi:P4 family phage/plasmid primase-like protien